MMRKELMIIVVIICCCAAAGCVSHSATTPENGENFTSLEGKNITYGGNQPVENLSFYLNDSQNFEIKKYMDGKELGVAYYVSRMYIEEIEWPGIGSEDPLSSVALTFREKGINVMRIYLIDLSVNNDNNLGKIEFSEKEKAVVEIESDGRFIHTSKIIVFDENGENPYYI